MFLYQRQKFLSAIRGLPHPDSALDPCGLTPCFHPHNTWPPLAIFILFQVSTFGIYLGQTVFQRGSRVSASKIKPTLLCCQCWWTSPGWWEKQRRTDWQVDQPHTRAATTTAAPGENVIGRGGKYTEAVRRTEAFLVVYRTLRNIFIPVRL